MYRRFYYIIVLYSRNLSAKFISPKQGFRFASAGKLICGFLRRRHLFYDILRKSTFCQKFSLQGDASKPFDPFQKNYP